MNKYRVQITQIGTLTMSRGDNVRDTTSAGAALQVARAYGHNYPNHTFDVYDSQNQKQRYAYDPATDTVRDA